MGKIELIVVIYTILALKYCCARFEGRNKIDAFAISTSDTLVCLLMMLVISALG